LPNKQTLKWIASLSTSAALALVLAGACLAPADHDVYSSGGVRVTVKLADPLDSPRFYGRIRPSQSLLDVRCQVWQRTSIGSCPDEATLARAYWPRLTQTAKTLYVGLPSSCDPYDYVADFNVEYLASGRTLIIHCHRAAPWIALPASGSGVAMTISTVLVQVSTDSIPVGKVRVVQDDRVEHLIGDQATESDLGDVNIT
jgi:hypothetical protein